MTSMRFSDEGMRAVLRAPMGSMAVGGMALELLSAHNGVASFRLTVQGEAGEDIAYMELPPVEAGTTLHLTDLANAFVITLSNA